MPTYAYRCDSCHHEFELFQSITARPIKKCPACNRTTVKRMIGTGAGVIFKGTGFYETDYRSESYKKAAQADRPKGDEASKTSTSHGDKKDTAGTASAKTQKADIPKDNRKTA